MDFQGLLQEILSEKLEEEVFVTRVEVKGIKRTSDSLLKKHFANYVGKCTFEDMIDNAREANSLLTNLGVYKSVDAVIYPDKAVENGYFTAITLDEKSAISIDTGVQIGQNEGIGNLSAALNNLTGHGDRTTIAYSHSIHGNKSRYVQFGFPLGGKFWQPFSLRVMQEEAAMGTCGVNQTNRHVTLTQDFLSQWGKHSVALESKWLHLSPLATQSPFAVRMQCGHFLNNSLTHTFSVEDTLNHRTRVRGSLTTQASGLGLGGTFNYIKNTIDTSLTYSRLQSLGLQFRVGARLGSIISGSSLPAGIRNKLIPRNSAYGGVDGDSSPFIAALPDRFLLGGAYDVRGFKLNSVGPSNAGLSLGGNTFWAAAAHIYSLLPLGPWVSRFGNILKLHGWVNAGNLTDSTFTTSPAFLGPFITDCNAACGVGLVLDFGNAAVELNYNVPLRTRQGVEVPGITFAVGMNFL